ncbi:ferredoxin [Rhodococcus sp. NPDC059968]|uniref:ferredoxin n=1 Tax=Rhodococcus sp. NPDC059968 TaxID=3347017 RepID=UPI00366FA722
MGFVIGDPCVDIMDKSCIEECPVDCIYEGDRMLYIHPTECIDCGACEAVCPVEAIRPMQRLPDEWKPFKAAAAELFSEVGSPGGSPNIDQPLPDPQFTRNYNK